MKMMMFRAVASGGVGGLNPPPPPFFDRSFNPISTRGGHIIPTQHYVPSRIFRPCDGPVTYVIIMEVGKNLGEEYKK